ncbi:UDP-2,3-diacylglucosamine diphosphatase [Odoribacter sp. OttesenSCG-928-J03]|nr:UDP-2,3-diacylglucosamine diphosphatase [Odoribacter sp. OttesenSCG-928-J03]MDL2283152.1 UDP-2,3-diacylglucosamine diphosphatase [Odoribacter sp. OttesenSCG-928-G04]MDL2330508.1 UDP-2,3-diacylglucosamine diphosphatase [Odoribacter sp. OttesenSCG-928-A06]
MTSKEPNGQIYFLSDAHLGASVLKDNREREQKLVAWLDEIRPNCSALFLLGDIFDFWFEYKRVVPKGFNRFLGKICEFTDNGIEVHFFTGNHDIWAFDYLQKECGMIIHTGNKAFVFNQKKFYIGHGDGLDPKDKGYLFIRKIFHNRFLQKCFRLIHPDCGIAFAHKWSSHSRLKENNKIDADPYRGSEEEDIEIFCRKMLEKEHFDYFIFGHRHLPLDIRLSEASRYINTGDWITYYSYAVFDGTDMILKFH